MRALIGFLLAFSGMPAALACSCGGSDPFLTMATRADLVVLATVQSHVAHGVDVRVDAVYSGDETRPVIRAWGDDGASCRPYTRGVPVGSQWVLALVEARESGPASPAGPEYAIEGCGEKLLPVSSESVYLAEQQARWRLTRLAGEIALLDRMPPALSRFEAANIRGLVSPQESLVAPAAPFPDAPGPFCATPIVSPIDGATLASVETIAAGRFDAPGGASADLVRAYSRLPSLCRVTGEYVPTPDIAMPFELWLPLLSWNGEAEGVVIAPPGTSHDLLGAVDSGALLSGSALFALGAPPGVLVDADDAIEGFRAIVGRLRPSNMDEAHAFRGGSRSRTGGVFSSALVMPTVARGPGRIEGRVTLNNEPVEGLRLRLVLNAGALSPWVGSDRNGVYSFDLPFGSYSIDGYELDVRSADAALPGATDHPRQSVRMDAVDVGASGPAQGLHLRYTYPVRIQWPVGTVSVEQARRIVWDPYPGAQSYRVRVSRRDPRARFDRTPTTWTVRDIAGTAVDIPAGALALESGRYFLQVTAFDAAGEEIARAGSIVGQEFRIVE